MHIIGGAIVFAILLVIASELGEKVGFVGLLLLIVLAAIGWKLMDS